MNRKWRFCLKDKLFPFPVLIFAAMTVLGFLEDDSDLLVCGAVLFTGTLVFWGFIGPEFKPPFVSDPKLRPPSERTLTDASEETKALLQSMAWWGWTKHIYEDKSYRSGQCALMLFLTAAAAALLVIFDSDAIVWRAGLIIGLCALGLLILVVLVVVRKLRKKEDKDRAGFPMPQVNMTYDHDAAADSRVRAMQQRLERLEEWKNSGLIDKEEYEELRKKYLGK